MKTFIIDNIIKLYALPDFKMLNIKKTDYILKDVDTWKQIYKHTVFSLIKMVRCYLHYLHAL